MASINDYYILSAIADDEDVEKGIIKVKGTTKEEIQSKLQTKLSLTKITNTLEMFKKEGYVQDGIAVGKRKTFVITDAGLNKVEELFNENK